ARYGAMPDPGKPGALLSNYARTLTNQLLRFHTDRCDVVALFCIRQAKSGGLSQLCSSPAVHNEMLRHRPELCAALYEPVWRSRFGEEDASDVSSYPLPVWGARGGKFTSHYSRTFIEAAQRRPEVPRLSEAQAEAIELLHRLAEELSFEMSFRPGDIQFVNNHVIYHARRGFEDDPADGGRLLLRLWMAMPNSRALPEDHRVLWRNIEAGALRGGLGQNPTKPPGEQRAGAQARRLTTPRAHRNVTRPGRGGAAPSAPSGIGSRRIKHAKRSPHRRGIVGAGRRP